MSDFSFLCLHLKNVNPFKYPIVKILKTGTTHYIIKSGYVFHVIHLLIIIKSSINNYAIFLIKKIACTCIRLYASVLILIDFWSKNWEIKTFFNGMHGKSLRYVIFPFLPFKVKINLYEFSGKLLNIVHKTATNQVYVLKSKHIVERHALRLIQ